MSYADLNFYIESYLIGQPETINATDFPFYARKASQIVKVYTFDNIDENKPILEPVQMCCCELAEHIYNKEKQVKQTNGIKSEKVDDYSITYEDRTEVEAEYKQKEKEIIHQWLSKTGLLYRGV